jgi:hypothetical protein
MIIRKCLVPGVSFNAEFEVVVPYPGVDPVPDNACRHMAVETSSLYQFPEDTPGPPPPVRHKLRKRIKKPLVITCHMRLDMRIYGSEHIVFTTMSRQKHLDAGPGSFNRFYKNELVSV